MSEAEARTEPIGTLRIGNMTSEISQVSFGTGRCRINLDGPLSISGPEPDWVKTAPRTYAECMAREPFIPPDKGE